MTGGCNWFWGSHGCDLPPGHDLPHVCRSEIDGEACSEHDGRSVRYHYEGGGWSEWSESMGFAL